MLPRPELFAAQARGGGTKRNVPRLHGLLGSRWSHAAARQRWSGGSPIFS